MSELLVVDRLTTGYGRVPVVRDASLSVDVEAVAVFGANGAGKTTLLRALAGSLRAWSGRVALGGTDLARRAPARRVKLGLAHVPEGRHVFAAMSVADNLAVAGLVARGRPPLDAVYDLFPRLAARRRQLAGSLSGGEQQMLAIGRALMTTPRVLLVDEMSAGLAPLTTQQLVAGLRAVVGMGVGVLLVEQSPALVADLVDRVYLLRQGRVVGHGTLAELGGVGAVADLYLGLDRRRPPGPDLRAVPVTA
jgi:branched-chain amino acid transport system ATP-binding protein